MFGIKNGQLLKNNLCTMYKKCENAGIRKIAYILDRKKFVVIFNMRKQKKRLGFGKFHTPFLCETVF